MEMFSVPSSRDGINLSCYRWIPEGGIRCIVQIAHGMLEYIPRYEELALFFNEHGIAVIGHDHLGHGRSNPMEPGFFNDENGDINLIEDLKRVSDSIEESYPGIPHFILGHSMGSTVTRRFITKYGGFVKGVVLIGAGERIPEEAESRYNVSKEVADTEGPHAYSEKLDLMVLGKNFSRVKVGASDTSQMTEERRNRLRFQAGGYRDMFKLSLDLVNKVDFDNIPKDMKILFLSGSEDLVGDKGEGILRASESLEGFGITPQGIIYEGMNHDIIHEENHRKVFDDILAWIEDKL